MSGTFRRDTKVRVESVQSGYGKVGVVEFTNPNGIKIRTEKGVIFYPWATIIYVAEVE